MAITAQLQKLRNLGELRNLDRGQWLRLWSEHGPMAVSTILVLLIAAVFASNILKVLAPPPAPTASPIDLPRPAASVDVGSIIGAHLFGAAALPAGDPSAAPATSMNLFLAGTIAGANPESGWAIIGENAMSARVVRAGSQLPGGALLKAVYPDRVVLELGGRLESLLLPRLAGGAGPMLMQQREAPATNMTYEAVRAAMESNRPVPRMGELVRPQPVFANGKLRGVRAYPGSNRQVFSKLGLQPGDLVTAINGAQLDDAPAASASLRNLGSEPVQLTVERNGEARQISVDPAAVANMTGAGNNEGPPEGEP